MKRFLGTTFSAVALVGVCAISSAFAVSAKKNDSKTKAANEAHSTAPVTAAEGAPAVGGAPAAGSIATGESMQGTMSPEMTKWITEMKTCHKGGKTDQKCHDRIVKSCEAKLTKEQCSQVMSGIQTDGHPKM